jgi:thiol-disulfide isomerase/thioredoxin
MSRQLLIGGLLVLAAAAGFLLRQAIEQDPKATQTMSAQPGQPGGAARPAATGLTSSKVSFALPDLTGNSRDFAEWAGKARIVNFWATWCAPCRREIPLLKKTQSAQAANGLQVIGIAVDFAEDVINYAEAAEFNYPILVGQEDAMAVAESSGVEFIGLPFTMIVSPDGDLLGVHLGEIHEPQIDVIVAQLAALERGETSLEAARAALKNL